MNLICFFKDHKWDIRHEFESENKSPVICRYCLRCSVTTWDNINWYSDMDVDDHRRCDCNRCIRSCFS